MRDSILTFRFVCQDKTLTIGVSIGLTAMVEAINHIGQVMGIQSIAEFVENDTTLEKLKALGVNYAQGYRIAQPRPFPRSLISVVN